MPKKPTQYTVSDGKLVLTLEVAEEGGYIVTSPLDPDLLTQSETLEEAFENARDLLELLREDRSGSPPQKKKSVRLGAGKRPSR